MLKELGILEKKWKHVSDQNYLLEAKYNLFPKLSIYRESVALNFNNRSEIPVLACPK